MSEKDKEQRRHEKRVRWQEIRITQFGYVNYLLLTLASGALVFGAPLTKSDDCDVALCSSAFYEWALFFLVISVITGIACAFIRLYDFRCTAKITKLIVDRDGNDAGKDIACLRCGTVCLGKVSWRLVWLQILSLITAIFLFAIALRLPVFQIFGHTH